MAAIMGAITTYIEMEQHPLSVTPKVKPQPKVSRWRVFKRQRSIRDKKS